MANGTFEKGTWTKLPGNCTRNYPLTLERCAEYGVTLLLTVAHYALQIVQDVITFVSKILQACIQSATKCCNWWPCSWICGAIMAVVCVMWAVLVIVVAIVLAVVVVIVVAVVTVLSILFCLVWSVFEIIICMSSANGGTAFLLTDGTIMVQECKSVFGANWATNRWWRLMPDSSGSYVQGSWHWMARSIRARRYFASAVLADGRVL